MNTTFYRFLAHFGIAWVAGFLWLPTEAAMILLIIAGINWFRNWINTWELRESLIGFCIFSLMSIFFCILKAREWHKEAVRRGKTNDPNQKDGEK